MINSIVLTSLALRIFVFVYWCIDSLACFVFHLSTKDMLKLTSNLVGPLKLLKDSSFTDFSFYYILFFIYCFLQWFVLHVKKEIFFWHKFHHKRITYFVFVSLPLTCTILDPLVVVSMLVLFIVSFLLRLRHIDLYK